MGDDEVRPYQIKIIDVLLEKVDKWRRAGRDASTSRGAPQSRLGGSGGRTASKAEAIASLVERHAIHG